eukprot:1998553-Lingulodinium_polyedra.AAC.1
MGLRLGLINQPDVANKAETRVAEGGRQFHGVMPVDANALPQMRMPPRGPQITSGRRLPEPRR